MHKVYAFLYSLRQSMRSLFRNAWLALITAGMIAISLVILGGFLLVTVNVNHLIDQVGSNVEIGVFLHDDSDVAAVEEKLDHIAAVVEHTFVSKEEGLADFAESMGDPALFADLAGANNPLPDLIRIQVTQPEQVVAVAEMIEAYPEVESVDYGEEIVSRLMELTSQVNLVFLVAGIALALGALFLIVNIIRLSVVARQDEVAIMKYLGASNSYIRFPFLMEGMVMGWTGTVVAIAILGVLYVRLATSFSQDTLILLFQPVTEVEQLWPIFVGLAVVGTLLSGLASFVSIRKYLRV